jgi:hypothetical protein
VAGEEVVAPVPGTPEYDAAMVAKADAALNPAPEATAAQETPGPADRPEWLPEKFDSPEALAKAYAELEQKQGGKPTDGEPEVKPEAKPEGTPEATEAEKVLSAAGLDYAALNEEFATKGELSEESYTALAEKAGLSREYVDSFIAGQQALEREAHTRAYDIAGGEEQYGNITAWAAANLPLEDIKAFNEAITSNASAAALAVAGLKAKYVAANGSEPTLLNGGNGATQEAGFASTAEMTAAMKDPRYAKDPAYRKTVEQKISRSTQLF